MSCVTSVVATLDSLDRKFVLNRINTWLKLAGHRSFVRVDEIYISA